MSGIAIGRVKLVTYTLGGLLLDRRAAAHAGDVLARGVGSARWQLNPQLDRRLPRRHRHRRRALYAIGNRERAAYLSGIDTRRTTLLVFMFAGALSGLGGVLLAGYSNKAYQGMGDGYLMPAVAAVVLGGTHIQGGKGAYLGTVGVILITLLGSILSVMQIPELGRQIIYGTVILGLLLT